MEPSSADDRRFKDPTDNVMLIVNQAVSRLDDLRIAESNRQESLREALKERLEGHLKIHVEHIMSLMQAESNRINAIRAVDVGAVAVASDRASDQAAVLAQQVSTSAETLRALVATTANTVASQLAQLQNQLAERISLLEKAQYEKTGLSGIPPAILDRIAELERAEFVQQGRSGMSVPLIMLLSTFAGGMVLFLIQSFMKAN